jgi:hypothetical protein
MFLALVALGQLNILLTRNPTFFWRFGPKSAPRPSAILLLPMIGFLVIATFVAVYWPNHVAPDGGLGNMEGAGAYLVIKTRSPKPAPQDNLRKRRLRSILIRLLCLFTSHGGLAARLLLQCI